MLQYFEDKHLASAHALLEFEINRKYVDTSTDLLKTRAYDLGKSTFERKPIKLEIGLRLTKCNVENIQMHREEATDDLWL